MLSSLRLLEQHLYEQGLDGLSVRIDLGDLVAQGSQQSLRVRSALRVSALAGIKLRPVMPTSCFCLRIPILASTRSKAETPVK
jgi:hypothetical protein